MATHDYVIANASGAAVRADLNNALAAIVTNNSNATEPATTYPYMLWADTTAGQLKLRNGTNDAWVVLFELDGTFLMEDGTVAAPGLAFASDIDTGFYRPAADQLAVATNGVERVKYGTTEVVFNDGAEDYDFRVEGSTQPSLIATNAGDDTISFGGNITSDTVYDGDVQMASQNGGPLAGFRNHLINGAMVWAQRSTDVTPSGPSIAGYLTADRWAHSGSGDNVGRIVRDTSAASIGAPPGFDYTLHFVDGSKTSRSGFVQMIELPLVGQPGPFAPNTQWTLSFWINIDLSGLSTVENLTFADDSNGTNSVTCGPNTGLTYTQIDTAPNNWKRYSVTYTLNSSAPASTNTGLRVNLGLATKSGQLAITGVQFEPGPVATPFEQRPYATELALCQRYYQNTGVVKFLTMARFTASGGAVNDWWQFAQEMRSTPTITNNGVWSAGTGYTGNPTYRNTTKYGTGIESTNTVSPSEVLYLSGDGFSMDAEL